MGFEVNHGRGMRVAPFRATKIPRSGATQSLQHLARLMKLQRYFKTFTKLSLWIPQSWNVNSEIKEIMKHVCLEDIFNNSMSSSKSIRRTRNPDSTRRSSGNPGPTYRISKAAEQPWNFLTEKFYI